MFGCRVLIDAQPRSKNGQPAHHTTGVEHTRPSQLIAVIDETSMARSPTNTVECHAGNIPSMSAIVRRNTGTPRAAAIHNRRVMSTSSGFGPSSSETVIGSRAIPHLGHAPGPCCTISGCIGHV